MGQGHLGTGQINFDYCITKVEIDTLTEKKQANRKRMKVLDHFRKQFDFNER